ncbi:hypothetical protein BH11PLA2_BH11PLA2_42650 [soil metagenome]
MAKGRSRMDLRRENDAVEARTKEKAKDEDKVEDEEEEDEDEDEEEDDEEGDVEVDGEAEGPLGEDDEDDDDGGEDDDEDGPRKKKKKKLVVKKVAAAKPARKRTVKEVRMKATWVVFDNGSKRVGAFAFSEKKDAEKLLAEKIEEKKATFYLQLVKEPLELSPEDMPVKKTAKKKA